MANIPDLSKLRAAGESDKQMRNAGIGANRIVFEFPDDHGVSGSKVDVRDVTPEQIFVAIGHLQRIALMLMAQQQAVALQAEQEAIAVQSKLAAEKKGN